MTKEFTKPPMYDKGNTLFLTIAYPPNPTASAVVHRHLLDQFDPSSFAVITGFFPGARKAEVPHYVKQHFIYLSFEFLSSKLHRFFARIQRYTIPVFLRYYIRKYKPARIVIGYPDLYWLDICSAVALKKNIPFIPYLHDTIVEATYFSKSKDLAALVQERVFTKSYNIAVMSEGMRALYQEKYKLPSVAWEHIYPEEAAVSGIKKENRAHWSGDVYEINYKSVLRLNNALSRSGMQFSISNGKSREQLKAFGITGDHLQKVFFPARATYLQHLNTSRMLLLGLNYADECTVHEDELATIFSTKTPEYLGSDALMVYHGPGHYFLAKFILEHDCGVVIESRDEVVILDQLEHINNNFEQYYYKVENAKRCMRIFNADYVSNKLIKTLDA